MTEGTREVWLFRVDRLEQRSKRAWLAGVGSEATFSEVDLGWFAVCGHVAFDLGLTKPNLSVGDLLELRRRLL